MHRRRPGHRRQGRQDHAAAGTDCLLKRWSSPYRPGRKRGDWWKWKIDPLVIDALRARTDSKQVAVIESAIKPGDNVKIVEGALRGLGAVVTEILSGRERVRALLSFLGREIHAYSRRAGRR